MVLFGVYCAHDDATLQIGGRQDAFYETVHIYNRVFVFIRANTTPSMRLG